MTVRDHVRRRVLTGYVLALAGAVIIATWFPFADIDLERKDPVIAVLTFVPFFAGLAFLAVAIRCPSCQGNLSVTPAAYPAPTRKHLFNFCPYCRLPADSRLDARHVPTVADMPAPDGRPTIREYMRRKLGVWRVLATVSVVSLLLALPFLPAGVGTTHKVRAFLLYGSVLAVLAYSWVALRCPRCRVALSLMPAAYPRYSRKHRFRYCPSCGASMDEPL